MIRATAPCARDSSEMPRKASETDRLRASFRATQAESGEATIPSERPWLGANSPTA